MSKIVQRVRRDLDEIAERAPISPAARDSILSRAATSIDHSNREVVMLERNTFRPPRRTWGIPVAVGIAAAALAIAGVVIIRGGDGADELAITDTAPVATEPTADEPTADEPAADEPPTGEPLSTEPTTDEPVADAPVTGDDPAVVDDDATGAPENLSATELAALPWARPDDRHDTPTAAVAAFVEFLAAEYGPAGAEDVDGQPLDAFERVTIGDFSATGDDTGTVPLTQDNWSLGDAGHVYPVTTIYVQRAGPDDAWWVVEATSDTMQVDAPTPGSEIAATFTVSGSNPSLTDAVRLHVFTTGEREPLLETFLTGGGVFAWGNYLVDLDLQTPPDTPGTLVVMTSGQVTTIPVTFSGEAPPGSAPGRPWHPEGSAHADPLAAVEEFLAFAGFDDDAALEHFPHSDGESTFVVDGDPDARPDAHPAYDPDDLPWSFRDTTSLHVTRDPAGHWVVSEAGSSFGSFGFPVHLGGAGVSSPLTFDVETVAGWGVTAELWPDGALAPISEVAVTSDADSLANRIYSITVSWDDDVAGPATLFLKSHDQDCDGRGCEHPTGAVSVVAVRLVIDG